MAELSIYIVSRKGTSLTVLSPDGLHFSLDKTYINPMFAAARVLYEHLIRPFSDSEWHNMTYMHDCQFRNLLRHSTMHSFYFEQDLFVPAPNLDFAHEFHPSPELAVLVEEALAQAGPCEAATEIDFVSFTQHPDPDYAAICLQDYSVWSGLNEALYVGHFKQGTERWNSYYLTRGDVPCIEDMPSLKGFVI